MMSTYLVPLEHINHESYRQVGMKAATLGALRREGFPVPPGVCVTAAAFDAALASRIEPLQLALRAVDPSDPASALETARQIESLLAGLELPDGLRAELQETLPTLGDGPLAVRSSSVQEDLPGASFAGQYKSILGAVGVGQVEGAILAVWRSYFSSHALAARAEVAFRSGSIESEATPAMAVLIQPLLDAECAGVLFSVDPVRQDPHILLMNSTWGLGLGVVEGSIPADTYRLRRSDLELVEAEFPLKAESVHPKAGGGLERRPVPDLQQRQACLPEYWCQQIAQFGLGVEQALGSPQDLEWAVANRQVWILQSRPVTTLPAEVMKAVRFPVVWEGDQDRRRLWFLTPISNRPGAILLPAEISFVNARLDGGWLAVEYGGGEQTRLLRYANGRLYMAPAESPLPPADRRIRSAAQNDLFSRLERQGITLWDYYGPEIILATERLAAFQAQSVDGPALADHLEDALAAARRHWMVHTLPSRSGRFSRLLEVYQTMTGAGREEAGQEVMQLLQGVETVMTRLVDGLYELAAIAAKEPSIAAAIAAQPQNAFAQLKGMTQAEEFLQQLDRFLAVYGARTGAGRGSENTLGNLPWSEQPDHVLAMVQKYLPAPGGAAIEPPAMARERARLARGARVDAICAATASPQLIAEFRSLLTYGQRNAIFTDEHNHYIDQLSEGQTMQALLHAGRWLARRGDLSQPEDVFWLYTREVLLALRSNEPQRLVEIVAARRNEYATWSELIAPAVLGLPWAAVPDRPLAEPAVTLEGPAPENPQARCLAGQAVSLGQGSGRARVARAETPLPDIAPGDVLVAADAGPLWTPIFPVLAGLVLDRGSGGQHAAITAREFGVPAVFQASGATRRIPEGAWVTVDGSQGTVCWE